MWNKVYSLGRIKFHLPNSSGPIPVAVWSKATLHIPGFRTAGSSPVGWQHNVEL